MVLVLASGSNSRRRLLEAAGVPVRVVLPAVDERALQASLGGVSPNEVSAHLARAKARDVASRAGGFVLGADQVLWDGSEVIGKPDGPRDHRARLLGMRGKTHDLITSWCLVGPDGGATEGGRTTRLRVRADLTEAEVAAYVDTGEGSPCAGGYAIEGHGGWLFESLEGCYFNVLGLPMLDVLTALRGAGWRYPVEAT
jgi:septum formation protein